MHASNTHLERQIHELQNLLTTLQNFKSYEEKIAILNALPIVQEYSMPSHPLFPFLKSLTQEAEYAIKSVLAIGQGSIIFNQPSFTFQEHFNRLALLVEQLLEIEMFYHHMGGIIGYHLTVIQLIKKHQASATLHEKTRYVHPEGLDMRQDDRKVRQAVRWGIENMDKLALICPLGGAGDRLNLTDDAAETPLPAACLPFLGRTLLEGLIRDLQAIEYVYFKLFGKQLLTPLAIMTSVEKNNHTHILKICKARQWFGRPSESFYFFTQPVVPMITLEGHWSVTAPFTLTLKPCGHGVLWKLAEEQGVFQWLESKGRPYGLIRQINNPLAGTDKTLLGLIGLGCHQQKTFGFASCERFLHSDEGINVLIEAYTKQRYTYCLTNIEYTDFVQKGIQDLPAKPGSAFSLYPANTNILLAHLPSMREVVKICPIPGQLINMKAKVSHFNGKGEQLFVTGGRLESTMQNIADFIVDDFPRPLHPQEHAQALRTFIVYNDRIKTISTTKKAYKKGDSPLSTPEQAYFDLLFNHYELLEQCGFELPPWRGLEEYLDQGPACLFLFHPGLGPLYSVITQKIRKGRLALEAEMQLEIAEVDIEDLTLTGSLLIESIPPLGIYDASHTLRYGQESRCTIKQVTIRNKGINRQATQQYWKNDIIRYEAVKILLHEGSEFHAEGITLEGAHIFEVPPHHSLRLSASQGQWVEELLPLSQPTWCWKYEFNSQDAIQLTKQQKGAFSLSHPSKY